VRWQKIVISLIFIPTSGRDTKGSIDKPLNNYLLQEGETKKENLWTIN